MKQVLIAIVLVHKRALCREMLLGIVANMRKFGGWLAGAIGWTASVASWVGVSVSAVVAAAFSVWAWATQWGPLPVALTALGTFTASIWAYRGIVASRRPGIGSGLVQTYCKLLFANDSNPTGLDTKNIRRWFALNNIMILINQETGQQDRQGGTSLFLTFTEAVAIKQIHVRAQGGRVPSWEVKDRDPWQVIISFDGLLSGLILEVEIEA